MVGCKNHFPAVGPIPKPYHAAAEESPIGLAEDENQEPDREPIGKYDCSLSPATEGRWTGREILPPAPTPLPAVELDKLLEKEVLGKAQKVYVVHPAPWPGVYLSWTSVAAQRAGVPGTHQCAGKCGNFPALDPCNPQDFG